MSFAKKYAAAAALVALSGAAQAALVDRGNGLIYDDVNNITWMSDLNYAFTSGYAANPVGDASGGVSSDGKMTWASAMLWAQNVSYGGLTGWRLPTLNFTTDTACSQNALVGSTTVYYGTNCSAGELSRLFNTQLAANTPPFSNKQNGGYWSSTEATYLSQPYANAFLIDVANSQEAQAKTTRYFAVAVRDGDVPAPPTLALALLALGATVVARKRQSR